MLTRSDMLTLGIQVDVNKAYDLLRMFKEAGQSHIDIETILDEAAPKIGGVEEYIKKLEHSSQIRKTCNFSELATWLNVSRQTVYNWKKFGYLVYDKTAIDLAATVELWKSIPWLSGK